MSQNNNKLPPKEAAIFKQILKLYETKQYKKGLKQAELLLKKFPNHGETLAMKGLTLNCLNKKDEAYQFVRLGLKNDMTSYVCWHVYGLLYRADKNYPEAIKCYRNALKHDPGNQQILRDLAALQIHTRDLEGFRATRMELLKGRNSQRPSWIGLAIAYHLLGNHEQAVRVLDVFGETQSMSNKDESITALYENGELLMYKVSILAEAGDAERAIKVLEDSEANIVDKEAMRELKGQILAQLGRVADAEAVYRGLLKSNPENRAYYLALEKLVGPDNVLAMYDEFQKTFPRAHFPRRRALFLAAGDGFKQRMDSFLQSNIRKGTPSLFTMVKPLYTDADKVAAIQALIDGYHAEYLKTQRFTSVADAPVESPSGRLWLEYFMSQHYDRVGDSAKALALADMALDHTPTCIDVYVHKAKIYKHAGDHQTAADLMNEARELDTADRYLNSKCVKYMLRADRVGLAEETVGLFTREGVDQIDNLVEMQCMWFAQAAGQSFARQGKIGQALKKFHQVEKHFADIEEDQFDFHGYCMRKMTLRAYLGLLRLEDKLRGHNFYRRAAHSAMDTYLAMHDAPHKAGVNGTSEVGGENTAGLSEKELKKLLSKQRRDQARKAATQEAPKPKAGEDPKKGKKAVDSDPEGAQYVNTTDPLGEATKFLTPLVKHAADDVMTHVYAAKIYVRRQKYLLALRALKAGLALDQSNPELHHSLMSLAHAVKTAELPPKVRAVVDEELAKLLNGKSAAEASTDYYSAHQTQLPHVISAGLAKVELEPSCAGTVAAHLASTASWPSLRADVALRIYRTLKGELQAGPVAEEYKKACAKTLPLATWCRS